MPEKEITIKDITAFFGMTPREMVKEWKELSDTDKADIRSGLQNGSLTYAKASN